MAIYKDGTQAKIGNLVRGALADSKIVRSELSEIRSDGTGVLSWLELERTPAGCEKSD